MVKNDREYKAEVKRWAKDVIASIKEEPADDLTCEDCDETSDDVAICTEPVRSSVQIDPPDSAALCTRCHDRRLHPRDYYDGPDRRDEDGD